MSEEKFLQRLMPLGQRGSRVQIFHSMRRDAAHPPDLRGMINYTTCFRLNSLCLPEAGVKANNHVEVALVPLKEFKTNPPREWN